MSASLESLIPEALHEEARPRGLPPILSFLLIGGGAALAFVAVSSALIALPSGLPKWLISAACYAGFIGPVYLLHRRFSFQSSAPHRQALPRYVAVQACAVVLAIIFSYVMYGLFSLPNVLSAVLVAGLTSGVNFIVLKSWAFATRHPHDGR